MARLSLNVDQETFDGASFSLVPAGRHRVIIFDVKLDEVKTGENKGKPRLKFQFKIADGEPGANRRLFHDVNAFNTEKSKPFDLISIGRAIGLDKDAIADIDTDDWLGQELFVTVTHKEKKTKESGYKDSFVPAEFREECKGFRSVDSAEASATAAEAVTKASTGAKAKASGSKFTL